jgi:hypothetical protein
VLTFARLDSRKEVEIRNGRETELADWERKGIEASAEIQRVLDENRKLRALLYELGGTGNQPYEQISSVLSLDDPRVIGTSLCTDLSGSTSSSLTTINGNVSLMPPLSGNNDPPPGDHGSLFSNSSTESGGPLFLYAIRRIIQHHTAIFW